MIWALTLLTGAGVASANNINVAILSALGNHAYDTNVLTTIQANAPFMNVTLIDVDSTGTPDPDLSTYASVMVIGGNSPFADPAGLGSELDSYVRSGHGVVIAAYANLQAGSPCAQAYELCGNFNTNGDWAISPGPQNGSGVSHPTLGTIHVANSPLLANVTALDGGSSTFYIVGSGVAAGATDVVDWSTGVPLVATKTVGTGTVVGLNMYPPNNQAYGTFWVSTSGGGQLMANALSYSAGYEGVETPETSGFLLSGIGLTALSLLLRRRR